VQRRGGVCRRDGRVNQRHVNANRQPPSRNRDAGGGVFKRHITKISVVKGGKMSHGGEVDGDEEGV
jgi:hypothetical protein